MPAKHTAKKTVKRKVTSRRRVKPVENVITQEAPATVIPNTSFQPMQPIKPVQPVQPVQPIQPITPVQPVQPIQPVSMPSASQAMPVQETSSFENSAAQPVEQEPEIKMGTEEKPTTAIPTASPQITTDNSQSKSGEKKNLLLPILVLVLLGIAVLGGLFIYRENFTKRVEKINEVSLSPTPVEKPTAKPLDLTKFEIEILNGSGIEGAASSQKSDLEGMGFKVVSIDNADESNYTKTVIQAKKDVDGAFLDKLKTTLEESFEVSTETLNEDAETDVIIVIGSSKKE